MIPKSVTLNPIPRILQPTQRLHPSALLPQSASVTVTENSVKTQSGTALLHGAAQWTDQTGAKRFTTEVVADTIQLLGKRPEGDQQQGGYQGGYTSAPGYSAPAGAPVAGPAPVSAPAASPAPVSAPVAAPVAGPAPASPQPQVSPDYQGPLPAAEPSDDLPF